MSPAPSRAALKTAQLRPATAADIDTIAAIYAHHVKHGVASFEETAPDVAEMRRRFETLKADGMPYLVAEAGGRVVAYAYAGYYRTRPAYRNTVEDSVYVDPDCMGAGLGGRLLAAVIEACTALGFRQMLGIISDDTGVSVKLHARHGFTEAGVLKAVGFKHGRWVDTVMMQRPLGAGAEAPPE